MVLNTIISAKFRNAFEQKCFQLIIEAYKTSLSKHVIQLDWNENDISQELCEILDKNPNRLKWGISASREFHLSNNTPKKKGFADKLPRIDLRMSQIISKFECKCFFEAKRLKQKDSGLKRDYINEGIDRFISKRYPLGCMLGYLLEGKTDETIKGINSLLKKDKRHTEILNFTSNKLFKFYYESNHSNIGIMKHLIFDFTDISN